METVTFGKRTPCSIGELADSWFSRILDHDVPKTKPMKRLPRKMKKAVKYITVYSHTDYPEFVSTGLTSAEIKFECMYLCKKHTKWVLRAVNAHKRECVRRANHLEHLASFLGWGCRQTTIANNNFITTSK